MSPVWQEWQYMNPSIRPRYSFKCPKWWHYFKVKKVTVHPRTAHEVPQGEQRYSSTLSLTFGARWGGWSTPRPGRFTLKKDSVANGWAPRPVWTCAENLAPTGIRSLDFPARTESIYRLHYRGSCWYQFTLMSAINVPIHRTDMKSNNSV